MADQIEKFEVRNRWTGDVQFTAEISCAPDAPPAVKLGLAVRWGFEKRANLVGARLVGARLDGARLVGANLDDANLVGAKIKALIAVVTRINGGYTFHAYDTDQGVRIVAGCRNFSPAEYRDHVAREYPGTKKGVETLAIIAFVEERAAALGVAA